MGVEVHEFNANFFKAAMAKQMSFYSGEGFVRVVIRLFNQSQLFSLRLIESGLNAVSFFQSFETKHK